MIAIYILSFKQLIGIDDLMRFRTYEALLNHQTKKKLSHMLFTQVISKNPISEYNCGINTYKVNAISMVNEDGDKVFDEIIDKLSSGKDIDKQDIKKLYILFLWWKNG